MDNTIVCTIIIIKIVAIYGKISPIWLKLFSKIAIMIQYNKYPLVQLGKKQVIIIKNGIAPVSACVPSTKFAIIKDTIIAAMNDTDI